VIELFKLFILSIKSSIKTKTSLIVENIILRHQIIIYQRKKKPRLKNLDRIVFCFASKIWNDWKSAIVIVKPSTVISWHRKGFKMYWRWKSRKKGRPNIYWELIKSIRKLQKENPLWSPQRIQGELAKLGYDVSENTIAKYIRKNKPDPSKRQNWLTFLRNHAKYIVGIDFLVVRNIYFKAIYVFAAISHERRKIIHFAVTSKPHSQWAIQQLRETFGFNQTTKYIIRDNDSIYSDEFKAHIPRFGLKDKPTAYRCPWQNPIAERVIGTLRRECLDHVIIINERNLHDILHEFIFEYYNVSRTHLSLDQDSPEHRPTQSHGQIVSSSILGGLHHTYRRVA